MRWNTNNIENVHYLGSSQLLISLRRLAIDIFNQFGQIYEKNEDNGLFLVETLNRDNDRKIPKGISKLSYDLQ